MKTLIYPEWLIDGSGADAAGVTDEVVRARGQTLLPGLVNMHAHLTLVNDNAPFVPYMEAHSDVALALRAADNALRSLRAGVTTVRDCGSRGRTVLDLRAAINDGLVPGPRVVAAGWALTISGGHMRPFGGEVDGVEGVRHMVRTLVSVGADFIKVAGSGGGTPGSLADYPSFSGEEFTAISDAAHDLGRRVTIHCTANAAIARAADARADSIEHGYFATSGSVDPFDDALADRLAVAGISITPTLQVSREMADYAATAHERDTWRRRHERLVDHVARLHRAGVRLTAGSDAGWRLTGFDTYWRELEQMGICGLSPIEVIHAATGAASKAMGREDQFGTLRPGLSADLLVVDGSPGTDLRALARVRGVYLEGRRVAD